MSDTGYSLEEIRAERARRRTRQPVPAGQDGRPITLEDVRRERARRSSASAEAERPTSAVEEAEGGLAAFNNGLFLNFGDEIQGAMGGVIGAGGEIIRQGVDAALGDNPDAEYGLGLVGDAARRGYDTAYNQSRGALQRFREERPNAAAFTEGTGMAAPIVATMGQAAGPQVLTQGTARIGTGELVPAAVAQVQRGALSNTARGRGLNAWTAQTTQGASAGSAFGGVYGLGEDGGWEERLQSGNENAAMGAAFGAVLPSAINAGRGVLNTARPAWEGLVRQAERIPTPPPNSVGAMGGNLGAGGRRQGALRPPPPPSVPDAAIERIDTMAQRNRMSVDDVDAAFASARSDPQGQVVADVFGDAGVRTLRPMAQAPGETGGRAAEVARERFADAPNRIVDTLRRSLGVSESRAAAVQRLEGDYRRLSAESYEPLWAQEPTPQQVALYEERIAPLLAPDNPNQAVREIMQDAVRRAERQFELDAANGIVTGGVTDNLPRYLHYIKGALGDRASFEATPLRGTSGREIASIRQLYRRFSDMLDPPAGQGEAIIPNYRNTTARAGDYFTAREALEEGGNWLNMSADEVAASRANMTPFALEHARIGLADEIAQRVGLRGREVGNVNVANSQVLGSPEGQRRLMAAFDSPQQAASFITTVNQQNQLMRNAQAWTGGSSTYSNMAHGEDNAAAAAAESAVDVIRGEGGRAVMRTARQVGNFFSDNAIERSNNRAGEVLLRRIDTAEARAFTDEVIRILRQREAERASNVTATVGGASQTGAASAGQREQRD